MMNGNPQGAMAGNLPLIGWFKYFPNGTSNPSVASCDGPLARFVSSITYSATGVQTIVFTSDFAFAGDKMFAAVPCFAAVANAFSVSQLAQYNATTRTLVVQQHQGTSGYAAAANADISVNVFVYGDRSSI